MFGKDILVVYYSRTGFTATVAREIRKILDCDMEEIVDRKNRNGLLGFWTSAFEAIFKRAAAIEAIKKDPSRYGLVIVGTPVWANSLSSPVRTYLAQNKAKLNHVASFLTQGGAGGGERVFGQIKEVCGKDPIGILAVRDKENIKHQDRPKIEKFLKDLAEVLAISPIHDAPSQSVSADERNPQVGVS